MAKVYENELNSSFDKVLEEGDELYQTGGRLKETYGRFAKHLAKLGVQHALVGGYALILHGVRRFTEDIDLLVTEEGLKVIRNHLLGKGYVTIPGTSRNIRDAATGVRLEFVISGEFPGDGLSKPVSFPLPDTVTEEIDGN